MVRDTQWRARRLAVVAVLSGLVSVLVLPGTVGAAPLAPAQEQCGSANAGAANPQITIDRPTIGVGETATVNVSGTSFLVPPHQCGRDVFGGIYLFFGWVQPGGQWGPSFRSSTSANGLFGTSYSYPGEGGDAEVRDDGTGAVRLISFTPGGESGTSTPFHMDTNGNWSANVIVRGSTYTFKDVRTGASNSVDCTVVQCGIYSIGAHGKASRTNERFTPINFTSPAGVPIVPSNPAGGGAGGVSGQGSGPAAAQPGATPGAGVGSGSGSRPDQQGSGGAVGSTPTQDTAPAEQDLGVVGEIAEPASGDDAAAAPEKEHRDGERAAATVFEGESGGSGSGGAIAIGVAVAVLLAAVGGFVLVRRNRSASITGGTQG